MATWTFADYEEQQTDALRLVRARQHRTELMNSIDINVEADGMKVNRDIILRTVKHLDDRIAQLERRTVVSTRRPVSYRA